MTLVQSVNSYSFCLPPSRGSFISVSSARVCRCLGCWAKDAVKLKNSVSNEAFDLLCPVMDCDKQFTTRYDYYFDVLSLQNHVSNHFKEQGAYTCREDHCSVKFKSWSDLTRHTTNRHCLNPTKYPCEVPWCKRSGDNGFTRKDKLRDHVRNTHEKTYVLGRANRPIKPAVRGVEGAGSNA